MVAFVVTDEDGARRALYRLPPEEFLDARARLANETDDDGLAAAIAKLRKPTQAAWIVNAHVANNPAVVEQLTGLGARLAEAQAALETSTLRELTLERRRTVADVTTEALRQAGREDAGAAVRESVAGTFDAAVADPEIAAELGALRRPQSWSGFGAVAPTALTVVGEPERSRPSSARPKKAVPTHAEPPDTSAEQQALEVAEQELTDAEAAEGELQANLRRQTTRLATLQHRISALRDELDEAKRRTAAARRDRRQRQSTLDRRLRPGRDG